VDQDRAVDARQDIEKGSPYAFLVSRLVSPKTMMRNALSILQANTDQVVQVAIWETLDIKIYRRSIDAKLRIADDVYFPFADRERFQRVVIFLWFCGEPLDATSRPKGVGELADSENALAIQPRSFLVRHIGEKAKIVFLDCFHSAAALEAALRAMPVQD
jgi:hypothetical protein